MWFFFAIISGLLNILHFYGNSVILPVNEKEHISYTRDPNDEKCSWRGKPMCCEMLSSNKTSFSRQKVKRSCRKVLTSYIPSPHEIKHFEKATEIHAIPLLVDRKKALFDFMESDLNDSIKLLDRVRYRMTSNLMNDAVDDDFKYLSQFLITYSCLIHNHTHHSNFEKHFKNITITEWIEPLTVHARHPTSYAIDWKYNKPGSSESTTLAAEYQQLNGIPMKYVFNESLFARICNVDYVLLQKGNNMPLHKANGEKRRSYFFDAGTNVFHSALAWFMCSYYKVSQQ